MDQVAVMNACFQKLKAKFDQELDQNIQLSVSLDIAKAEINNLNAEIARLNEGLKAAQEAERLANLVPKEAKSK